MLYRLTFLVVLYIAWYLIDLEKEDVRLFLIHDNKPMEKDEDERDDLPDTQGLVSRKYVNHIRKVIRSKSHQMTTGISTIMSQMKRDKYDLEEFVSRDEAFTIIEDVANDMGFRTDGKRIFFQ